MPRRLGLLWLVLLTGAVARAAAQCLNTGAVSLPAGSEKFASAMPVTAAQEQQILALYSSLGSVGSYSVSLSSNLNIYSSSVPFCDTNQSTPSYNAQHDVWLCFS
jgi:hypothetical protein